MVFEALMAQKSIGLQVGVDLFFVAADVFQNRFRFEAFAGVVEMTA